MALGTEAIGLKSAESIEAFDKSARRYRNGSGGLREKERLSNNGLKHPSDESTLPVADDERPTDIMPPLMNLDIVRIESLKDYKGASAAWKKLLETNSFLPRKRSIVDLIVEAENKLK